MSTSKFSKLSRAVTAALVVGLSSAASSATEAGEFFGVRGVVDAANPLLGSATIQGRQIFVGRDLAAVLASADSAKHVCASGSKDASGNYWAHSVEFCELQSSQSALSITYFSGPNSFSQVQTGTQGIVGTGVQGIVGTGIQGIVGTGVQGIVGTGIQGIVGTGVQGIVGTGVQGIVGTGR
jgi:hypothetical protein